MSGGIDPAFFVYNLSPFSATCVIIKLIQKYKLLYLQGESIMKDITLVILAAGLGSRYGGGIKQLQKVGKNGEIIIDYSIHDALEAGFNKVVFIIRKDIEADFREAIGNRIEKVCRVEYVFQDKNDLPEGFTCPPERVKPWGTGQAVLACRDVIDGPFAVINADDYYGKEAFRKVYEFLKEHTQTKGQYCMAGFWLANTLSENGTVTRGVCVMDAITHLLEVHETKGIARDSEGVIRAGDGRALTENALVSMNMWGLTEDFVEMLDQEFVEFLKAMDPEDLKAEFLLPTIIDGLLKKRSCSVKVLSTADKWFGVTYAEDKDAVIEAFEDLIKAGVYGEKLWG